MLKGVLFGVLVFTILLFILFEVEADTITVDDSGGADYTSIQEAINASEDGDVIEVAAGVYYGNLSVRKSVTIQGVGNDTVIDLEGKMVVNNVEAENVTFDKLVLMNGSTVCISISGVSNFTMMECVIKDCQSGLGTVSGIPDDLIVDKCIFQNLEKWALICILGERTLIRDSIFKGDGAHGAIHLRLEKKGTIIRGSTFETNLYLVDIDSTTSNDYVQDCVFKLNGSLILDGTKNICVVGNTFESGGILFDSWSFEEFYPKENYIDTVYIADNTVNGKPILLIKDEHTIHHENDEIGQGIFLNCSDIVLSNMEMEGVNQAFLFKNCMNWKVEDSTFTDCLKSITAIRSPNGLIKENVFNRIRDSDIYNIGWGESIELIESNSTRIERCSISEIFEPGGIEITNSNRNVILDCTIDGGGWLSLDTKRYYRGCNNTSITNCTINGGGGLWVEGSGNEIVGCVVTTDLHKGSGGIEVWGNKNIIKDSTSINSTYDGIRVEGEKNLIENCIASGNGDSGIWAEWDCVIRGCTLSNNGGGGIIFGHGAVIDCIVYGNYDDGIYSGGYYRISVQNCEIYDNGWNGIVLKGSKYINITQCRIYNNTLSGVYLINSRHVYINDCVIRENGRTGLNVTELYRRGSNNNTIHHCIISGNPLGINVDEYSHDNLFYLNNLLDNTENVQDNGNNRWYIFATEQGNYWSNYNEPAEGAYDNDSNGIIDTPYNITGTGNQDKYPLALKEFWSAPDAVAGDDREVAPGTEVILDGSSSTDEVGIVNWTWDIWYGEDTILLYGQSVTLIFHENGTHVILLIVRDGDGLTGMDLLTVTVVPPDVPDTIFPTANAGTDVNVVQGAQVTFDGTGSSDNVGITSYTWAFDDYGEQTLTGMNPVYTFDNIGAFEVTLTVQDAAGNEDTDKMKVTVVDASETGNVTGAVIDEEGNPVAQAQIILNGSGLQTITDDNGNYSFRNVPAGAYTLEAVKGNLSGSQTVTVQTGSTVTIDITVKKKTSQVGGDDDDGGSSLMIIVFIILLIVVIITVIVTKEDMLGLKQKEEQKDEIIAEKPSQEEKNDAEDTGSGKFEEKDKEKEENTGD